MVLNFTPYEYVSAALQLLMVLSLLLAYKQLRASTQALKAQTIFKLIDEWRSTEIYDAFQYVAQLRDQWLSTANSDWNDLAKQWVRAHKDASPSVEEIGKLNQEWRLRRTASQFLAKMAALVDQGYLTPDEFFRVNPDVPRQLSVLWPIEKAIEGRFSADSASRIATWDRAFPKWEFASLWKAYERWWEKGARIVDLPDAPIALAGRGDCAY